MGKIVTIEQPEESFTLEDIQFAKKGVAKEIGRYFPDVATVQFTESYVLKQPEKHEVKESPKAEAKAAEAAPSEAAAAAKETAPSEASGTKQAEAKAVATPEESVPKKEPRPKKKAKA